MRGLPTLAPADGSEAWPPPSVRYEAYSLRAGQARSPVGQGGWYRWDRGMEQGIMTTMLNCTGHYTTALY